MEFEPIRERLARQLHAKGVHLACHSKVIPMEPIKPISFRRDDGTTYTPNVIGVFGARRQVHY